MNKERLNQLADVLESEKAQEHFDMNYTYLDDKSITEYGSVTCIAGWANILQHGDDAYVGCRYYGMGSAAMYLDLSISTQHELFMPDAPYINEQDPKKAAKVIRHLVATGEVDWSIIDEPESAPENS